MLSSCSEALGHPPAFLWLPAAAVGLLACFLQEGPPCLHPSFFQPPSPQMSPTLRGKACSYRLLKRLSKPCLPGSLRSPLPPGGVGRDWERACDCFAFSGQSCSCFWVSPGRVLTCEQGPSHRTHAEEPLGWIPTPKDQAFTLTPSFFTQPWCFQLSEVRFLRIWDVFLLFIFSKEI